jgi:TFIIH basal transcription factor complex TTD-A subunit
MLNQYCCRSWERTTFVANNASMSSVKKLKTSPTGSFATGPKRGDSLADDTPPSSGYMISCDVPTKQFIMYLNELKPGDKKFVLQDLDATHLLVKRKSKEEITRRVEEWLDENVFSAVEKVGEDFDVS